LGLTAVALGLLGVSAAANLPLAGSLDPSFGSGGVVTSPGSQGSPIGGIAVQPDGKIVVVGFGSLARYLPDGSPDSSFGVGGYVATAISDSDALALQSDGEILLAGATGPVSDSIGSEFGVARYKPDGSLDASFGTDGIAKTIIPEPQGDCSGNSYTAGASALAVLRGGDILAAGSVGGVDCDPVGWSRFALVRYRSDGSLDSRFGHAGIVQTSFDLKGAPRPLDWLGGIAVQPNGRIVAAGSAGYDGHGIDIATMALARYNPNGSLDRTFGTGGKATTNPKLFYSGGPTALQQGKILVAGASSKKPGTKPEFPVVARYDASGRLDSAFGQHGFAATGGDIYEPTAMLAQNDGKILIAETASYQGPSAVVRLLPNGRRDKSFGRGGIVSLHDEESSLALQTERKMLVGGGNRAGAWTLSRLIGGNNCVVPDLRGKTVSKASITLKGSDCRRGRVTERFSKTVARGHVISTAPRQNVRLPGSAKVGLVVSKGR
jgi:uncharacterized delta-60 repeat protein